MTDYFRLKTQKEFGGGCRGERVPLPLTGASEMPPNSRLRLLGLPPLDHLRPVVDLHSEREPHVGEDLFDFLQALTPEVLRLQHVLLGALNQLADERDVRVLQ